jgi:hypothetical protein
MFMHLLRKQFGLPIVTVLAALAFGSPAKAALNTAAPGLGWSGLAALDPARSPDLGGRNTKFTSDQRAAQIDLSKFQECFGVLENGGMTSPVPSQSQVSSSVVAIAALPIRWPETTPSGTVIETHKSSTVSPPSEPMLDPPRDALRLRGVVHILI